MKKNQITLKDVIKNELKNPEFSFFFQHHKFISQIARLIRDARIKANMTQIQLATRAKTTQAVIARLESGADKRTPSLALLERIAKALRARLMVGFEYNVPQ